LLTSAAAARIQATRRNLVRKLRGLMTVSTARLAPVVNAAKAFGDLRGFGDAGAGDGILRQFAGSYSDALDEIDSLGIGEQDIQNLGSALTAQRTGDIAAALGIDVTFDDLIANCGSEFTRIRSDLAGFADQAQIIGTVGFERISAVFREQDSDVETLQRLASAARGLYTELGGGLIDNIVNDTAAFGEGGLRQMVQELVGPGADKWLTGDNLRRAGDVANAWVAAGSSGSALAYVSAAAGTLGAVGVALGAASVAVPVGTIIAAVGAVITLLATLLLGDEDFPPPPTPPEAGPCVDPSSPVNWRFNPEAWTALAMWIVAKEGYEDSPTFRSATGEDRNFVQDLISRDYHVSIDRYTGELMVQETPSSIVTGPTVRLLDFIDREVLIPAAEPNRAYNFFASASNRRKFGLVANRDNNPSNVLFCEPHQREVLTRFFGADQFRPSWVLPFRRNPSFSPAAPDHIGWNSYLGDDTFWKFYAWAMISSIYTAGTVPYGLIKAGTRGRRGGLDTANLITLGVGCTRENPEGIFVYINRDNPIPCAFTQSRKLSIPDLRTFVTNDPGGALYSRIPQPSPVLQASPGDVLRPSNPRARMSCSADGRICLLRPEMTLRTIAAGSYAVRDEKEANVPWSLGKKIVVGAGAAIAVGGTAYLWSRSKKR
jgi:hypothetical protein